MVHDPYRVEPRRPLTSKQKLRMFISHDGICCICGLKIDGVSEAWDEHVNPLWLSGDNSAENRAPAHERCAKAKSAKEARARSKGRRVSERHFGARKTKRPMPGSRNSRWKKHMDGSVSRR